MNIKYWKGKTGTPKEGQFGTKNDTGTVPDSDECTQDEYNAYVAGIPKTPQYVEPIRRDLKAVPNINKLRADSISILNQINSNGFTAEDTIPAIKKLAETQKAILDTLLNL